MKIYKIVFSIFILTSIQSFAQQSPNFTWGNSFGGTANELVGSFAQLSMYAGRYSAVDIDENGYLYIVSNTESTDGDITSYEGDEDIFLRCLDTTGVERWSKMIGGNSFDRCHQIKALPGGGCVLVINTTSDNGIFSSNHGSSYSDGAVFVYDDEGTLQWSKLYGGENIDYLYDVIYTSDGNWMLCGESISSTGDLVGTGSGMNWVIKINPANGDIVWSKTFLGPDSASENWLENTFRMVELEDNNVILTGFTTPDYNDFNLDRIQVISIDLDGNLNWTTKVGATGSGDYPAAIVDNQDNTFFIAGRLQGTIGGSDDAANYFGGSGDMWLVNFNYDGSINWEKNYGGTNLDVPYDLKRLSDGTLYLAGTTRSTDNDAIETGYGLLDYFLMKLENDGDVIYTKKYGGSANDYCTQITVSDDESKVFMVGGSESSDGLVTDHIGARDIWLIRLDYPQELPNYGLRDDDGINLPEITYWYTDEPADITEKAFEFDASDFGTIDLLYLKGSSVKTWKSGEGDVTGTQLNYKVWKDGDTEPVDYTIRNIAWTSDDGDGNQTWADFGEEIPIIVDLTPGDYFIKILYSITGTGIPGILTNGPFVANFNIFDPSSIAPNAFYSKHLSVYPNPANDYVVVETNKYQDIQIYDIYGKLVTETVLNEGRNKIDLSNLSTGLYILKTKFDNQTIKLSKE